MTTPRTPATPMPPRRTALLVLALVLALAQVGCLPESNDGGDAAPRDTAQAGSDTSTSGADPLGMVAAHNAARAAAQPAPSPALPLMTWDQSVADTAQAWADGCVFEHSSNGYGENIYVASWPATAEEVVDSWVSEATDYDYAANSCDRVCGHYTQVVWRTSTALGCAYADCDDIAGFGGGRLWVCNYSPPGNWGGEKPY